MNSILADGNCLFRALADQLNNGQNHLEIRRNIVYHMRENHENFRKFISSNQTFDDYLTNMSRAYIWGDNLCIQAFCDIYSLNVNIIQIVNNETKETLIEPRVYLHRNNFQRVLNLLFDNLHYDSLKYY